MLSDFIFVVSILLVKMQEPMEAVANMYIFKDALEEEVPELRVFEAFISECLKELQQY